ncbi:hypothetical protein CC1G_05849 [Coprinopsis cinerea okayama7|uniref:Uncharacterized protein n=1 Tax=Coprinopsis cinerea (strain Okayama-7 / 130 / ATCC MYA-4618 / FGSC 9003) TaxID=240176 RepID=A8NLK7_COPC7|nr:hypothetical protein CC1G_05849 [Coprinopsis cinerea okayama7\|eukprot:XP_001834712.2 hypothetical protein CC1G_05849 [Coprinopsis cinerea okayama7\
MPTQLPESILHSSFVPNDDEAVAVRDYIQHSKASLSNLDTEIERLRASLQALEFRRLTLQEDIAQHEASLSPLRRLPPEILSEIFLYAQGDATVSWPRVDTTGASDIPWKFGRVCSYWRTVFMSLPKLWSRINIDLSTVRLASLEANHPVQARAHEFLQACLHRSGTEPLWISLRYQPGGVGGPGRAQDDRTAELASSLLAVLVGDAERWQDVALDLDNLFSYRSILAATRDRLPILHALSLSSSGNLAPAPRPWQAIESFLNAPRLTRLTLNNIAHPTHHLRMPWGQLKYLRSKGSTFLEGEFSRILKECVLLEEFTTEDERVLEVAATTATVHPHIPTGTSPPNGQLATVSSAVYLPHLHTLCLVNKSSYISRIFQLITAPSLTTLSIRARTLFNPEQTINMLRRSKASLQLRKLVMQSSKDPEVVWEENYGIVGLLVEVKGVRECVLRVSRSADEIIPRLTVKRGMGGAASLRSSSGGSGFGFAGALGTGYANGVTRPGNGTAMGAPGMVLLPNLQKFSLHDSFCVSTADVKAMLESRISNTAVALVDDPEEDCGEVGGVARLKEVRLELSRPAPPKYGELEELKKLALEKGVEMSISV